MIKKIRTFRDFYPYLMSDDYKIRFLGEYLELSYRLLKLEQVIEGYKSKSLDFIPSCSLSLLELQGKQMQGYKTILEKRAMIENIELPEVAIYGCKEKDQEQDDIE